jgi:hypothetical protein
MKIITDEASPLHPVLDFDKYSQYLAEIIENSFPRFTIGIFGDWGTGKTTLMSMIHTRLEHNNEKLPNVLPVWFNAWRYEKEERLAVIPFLRTISIALDNFLRTHKDQDESSRWSRLSSGLNRTFRAFISASEVTLGPPGAQVKSNLQSIKESLKSIPGDDIGNEIDTIYDNATGFLDHALDEIRSGENGDKYRIVVFVDDLDRCTPQNGLDVLESIKGLFDIKGLIYVLGMNPDTIDTLIEEKYKSRKKTVTGLDYMKKIVQLPFHIPAWSEDDIHTLVNDTITRELKGAGELQRIFEEAFSIVVQAIEPNPRETKRFINSMALSQAIFDYLPLDELMVVHALRFRQQWNPFLEFITDAITKKIFFDKYNMLINYPGAFA